MPRVPTYDNFQVMPTTSSGGGFTAGVVSPDASAAPGRQIEEFGNAVQKSGAALSDATLRELDQANQLRAMDALNKVRQHALDLTYGRSANQDEAQSVSEITGYAALKGAQALDRPDGLSLPDEYAQKFRQNIGDIEQTLSNDDQRRMFRSHADRLAQDFYEDTQKHVFSEYRSYQASVAEGAMKLAQQEAERNWNNPAKIASALDGTEDPATGTRFGGIKQAIYQQGMLAGKSALEIQAEISKAESSVHAKAVESALANGDTAYALDYFTRGKSKMDADDILKIQKQVNHANDAQMALSAVKAATDHFAGRMLPTDVDRLAEAMMDTESGGRQFGPDGAPLTSSKGAIGIAQVMPATAPEAAKLAGLDWDENRYKNDVAYNAALGRAYLTKQLQTFGDTEMALAAYNDGPGRVKEAIKKANAARQGGSSSNWLTYLPQETQDYVAKTGKKFDSAASPSIPTELEFTQRAVEALGPSPRAEGVVATREQAKAQYKTLLESRKQVGDQALAQAQRELVASGGNFAALSPKTVSDLTRYDPGKYDDARKFAKAVSEGTKIETNMEAYVAAVTYPQDMAKLDDPAFVNFLVTNIAEKDRDKLAKLRADLRSGKSDESPLAINNAALNDALDNRIANLGIDPKPKKGDTEAMGRIGAIQKFVRDAVYEQQKQIGRKLAPKEIEDAVDTLFAKSAKIPSLFGARDKAMLNMTSEDIPDAAREATKAKFIARGVLNPTPHDILRAYWTWKDKHD